MTKEVKKGEILLDRSQWSGDPQNKQVSRTFLNRLSLEAAELLTFSPWKTFFLVPLWSPRPLSPHQLSQFRCTWTSGASGCGGMIKTKLWRSSLGDMWHLWNTKSMPLILRPDACSFQSLMRPFVLRPGRRDVEKRRNDRMLPLLAGRQGSDITSLCYQSV